MLKTRKLRLEQVIQNLISNAVKYHHDPENGRIEIGCRKEGAERWRFWVQDDGPGIAEEHHERVFLMFQTLQPRDRVESTGLGLSLVTKLVEEEGGRVTLVSAEGEGARFEFTWPAPSASLEEEGGGDEDHSAGRSLRTGRRVGENAQSARGRTEPSAKNVRGKP